MRRAFVGWFIAAPPNADKVKMQNAKVESQNEGRVPDETSSPSASRVRYGVLAFLASLTFILYLDRVCISQAVIPIR